MRMGYVIVPRSIYYAGPSRSNTGNYSSKEKIWSSNSITGLSITVMGSDFRELFFMAQLLSLLFAVVIGRQGMVICVNQWEDATRKKIICRDMRSCLCPQLAQTNYQ